MVHIVIDRADDGKQVHKWLRLLLPGMPLSGIHKFIRTNRIKVNGKRAKRDTVLHEADEVILYMTEEDYRTSQKAKREKFSGVDRNIEVLYEDEEMLIVNKAMGVLVHAADGDYASTLQAQVEAYVYREQQKSSGQAFAPAPVHRLDRNTTGLVMFAKTSRTARELGNAFQHGEIEKTYLALVSGTVRNSGEVTAALSRDNETVTRVDQEGKESATRYWPLARAGSTTLLKVTLETGRTHQIRAHLAHIGHSLIGDVKYGGKRPHKPEPFYLHAAHLARHSQFDVTAPLPQRFLRKLATLGYDVDRLQHDLAVEFKV